MVQLFGVRRLSDDLHGWRRKGWRHSGRVASDDRSVVAEVMETAGTVARFRYREIGSIAPQLQDHVTVGVMNDSV
jgi:hypothetical protein